MSNETIDKLKDTGFITLTEDSQKIAEYANIGGGSSSLSDFISGFNVSDAFPKYITSVFWDEHGEEHNIFVEIDNLTNYQELFDAWFEAAKDYITIPEPGSGQINNDELTIAYTSELSHGDCHYIRVYYNNTSKFGVSCTGIDLYNTKNWPSISPTEIQLPDGTTGYKQPNME